jgi:hypothetical protein
MSGDSLIMGYFNNFDNGLFWIMGYFDNFDNGSLNKYKKNLKNENIFIDVFFYL